MPIVDDERKIYPIDLGIKGQGQLFTLCIKPFGHDTDCNFSSISFKIHMQVLDNERRNSIDFGLQGRMSRATLALCL